VKPQDFEFLSHLVKDRSGLVLTPEKSYLVESRLTPLARKRGMENLEELVEAVRCNGDEPLLRDVTDAMTTNESFFFRDQKPFDQFRETVLPAFLESRAGTKKLRIWCAAASSGQEPYSLAMCLQEVAESVKGWNIEIIGTDISREILEKAKSGIYSQFEVQRGLPIQLLVKYFDKVNEMWQIKPDLRAMVSFRENNLLLDFSLLGRFDVIFCRNVLIYFDQETKTDILGRMAMQMPDDGYLFLGGAETVIGVSDSFKPLPGNRGLYCLMNSSTN
jgi:chemotaxis protein methyltransferase CheR